MAEVILEIDVREMFKREDYEKLLDKIRRHGKHHLYFQGETIVSVRDSALGNRDTKLWIGNYTRRCIPPYAMLLKDIEYAIETYQG